MSDHESEERPPAKYICTRSCGEEVSKATYYRHQLRGCQSRSSYGRRKVRTATAASQG